MVETIPNKDYVIMNYYLLPLTNISMNMLPDSIFKSIFINQEGTTIFIEFSIASVKIHSLTYLSSIEYEDRYFQAYAIPDEYLKDVQLILKGKYSEISGKAKTLIIQTSGLPYMQKDRSTGKITTSAPLMALERSSKLRKFLEDKLSKGAIATVIPEDSELIDKLTDNVFIENIFKEQD